MDPTKKPAPDAQGEADDSAQADDPDARVSKLFDAKLNSALTARDKRLHAAIGKTLEEQLAPAREDKPTDKPADVPAGAAKADPEVLKLREQLDKLTRQDARRAPEARGIAPALQER